MLPAPTLTGAPSPHLAPLHTRILTSHARAPTGLHSQVGNRPRRICTNTPASKSTPLHTPCARRPPPPTPPSPSLAKPPPMLAAPFKHPGITCPATAAKPPTPLSGTHSHAQHAHLCTLAHGHTLTRIQKHAPQAPHRCLVITHAITQVHSHACTQIHARASTRMPSKQAHTRAHMHSHMCILTHASNTCTRTPRAHPRMPITHHSLRADPSRYPFSPPNPPPDPAWRPHTLAHAPYLFIQVHASRACPRKRLVSCAARTGTRALPSEQAHTCAHTHSHRCMLTQASNARTRTPRAHLRIHTLAATHVYAHPHTCIQRQTHTQHALICTSTCTVMRTSNTGTIAQSCTQRHSCIYTHAHASRGMRPHAPSLTQHACTHTRSHMRSRSQASECTRLHAPSQERTLCTRTATPSHSSCTLHTHMHPLTGIHAHTSHCMHSHADSHTCIVLARACTQVHSYTQT